MLPPHTGAHGCAGEKAHRQGDSAMGKIRAAAGKKGSAYLGACACVLCAMGIGTAVIAYRYSSGGSGSTGQRGSVISVEDAAAEGASLSQTVSGRSQFRYRTDISLGAGGTAYLAEDSVSETCSVYSGTVSYAGGSQFGVRVTLDGGSPRVEFGSGGNLPMAYTEYLTSAAEKMYALRFGNQYGGSAASGFSGSQN